MSDDTIRSRRWTTNPLPRYWWHRLPGMDYVPSIYSELAPDEWDLVSAWFEETDRSGQIGECVDRLLSQCDVMAKDVDAIFMTGGSSFVPAIRRIFENKFGSTVPIRVGQEFTSVAEGLAIYALESLEK